MFARRRRLSTLNSTAKAIETFGSNVSANLTNRTLKLHADAARLPHWDFNEVTDMFDILATAAKREARRIGLEKSEWKRKKGAPPISELGVFATSLTNPRLVLKRLSSCLLGRCRNRWS